MAVFDKNGDGRISKQELRGAIEDIMSSQRDNTSRGKKLAQAVTSIAMVKVKLSDKWKYLYLGKGSRGASFHAPDGCTLENCHMHFGNHGAMRSPKEAYKAYEERIAKSDPRNMNLHNPKGGIQEIKKETLPTILDPNIHIPNLNRLRR